MFEECFGEGPFIFRLNDTGTGPLLLTQVCLERGWREYSPDASEQWNLWWRTSGFPTSHYKNLYAWQYVNHIPKGSSICRKDNLVRYLRCMKKVYGSIYDFSPNGYNLPLEYTKLAAECSKTRTLIGRDQDIYYDDKPIWICKPVAQSQGRGIFLFKKLSELSYDTNTIVQRYIEKPLLIGGYKFDLRLYVCIPSYHPITIYLYREGLARFGTDKFTLNDLRNPFRHLTNSSINKLGPGYTEMKERIGSGCKWTLRQLRRYFQQAGISDWLLWQRISALVTLTLLSHVQQVPPTVNCFEFFGFDVLIDNTLRPWLLEVNLSPALGNDCDADRAVKKPMLHDMFDLLGLPLYNTGLSIYNLWNDDLKENSRKENNNEVLESQPSLAVMHAADRWRKKHRKMSARPLSRNKSGNKKKPRTPSSKPKTPSSQSKQIYLHKTDIPQDKSGITQSTNKFTKSPYSEKLALPFETHAAEEDGYDCRNVDPKRVNLKKKWGNGRDWKEAPPQEGDWVRIWPMNLSVNCSESSQSTIKFMVTEMIKFSKAARDIYRRHPTASECQLNEYLQLEMNMSRDIWIPPV